MSLPIRVTDEYEYEHLRESYTDLGVTDEEKMPVVVFVRGDIAYKFVSSPDKPGYGDHQKFKGIFNAIVGGEIIELPVLISNFLERGRFQVFDGRHRATIFMLQHEIIELGSYGAALDPEDYELGSTPFLTHNDHAKKLASMGYLDAPSMAFDTSKCKSKIFTL